MKVKVLSRVRLLVTPWTAAHQAPPSMGFSRQDYWSGVPLPSLSSSLVIIKFHHKHNHRTINARNKNLIKTGGIQVIKVVTLI